MKRDAKNNFHSISVDNYLSHPVYWILFDKRLARFSCINIFTLVQVQFYVDMWINRLLLQEFCHHLHWMFTYMQTFLIISHNCHNVMVHIFNLDFFDWQIKYFFHIVQFKDTTHPFLSLIQFSNSIQSFRFQTLAAHKLDSYIRMFIAFFVTCFLLLLLSNVRCRYSQLNQLY